MLPLFALDLTASDTARLTGLSVRAINDSYLRVRQRLGQRCRVPAELGGAPELDESYVGPRRVRGKLGRGAGVKPSPLACSSGQDGCTRKSCPIARNRRCKASSGVKSTPPPWSTPTAGATTTAWSTWATTATAACSAAETSTCKARPTSTASESFWRLVKGRLHQFVGVPDHPFLLHLKEWAFRFNHRYENLYKLLLKEFRQHPLLADLLPKPPI